MNRICKVCYRMTNAVAIRNGGGSFSTMGRGCPKCRVITMYDMKGYSFAFDENIINKKDSEGII